MRILIADDFEPIRTAVAGILSEQPDWEVCGEACNGTEALRLATELNPDVVLLDISMPGIDGLKTSRLIHESVPSAKIIILSHHDPAQLLKDARKSGAQECVDKGRIAADLVASIRRVQIQEKPAA
jgi:DNA-binding NarL/FixJ family response regulator